MRRSLLLTATLLTVTLGAAFLLAGCVDIDFGPSDRYQASFNYSYDFQPGERLSIENTNGSVEISGWDQNKIEITGTRYASTKEGLDQVKIDVVNDPGLLQLRTVRPSDHRGSLGARYTIQAPRGIILDRITSTNGHIRVHDVESGGRITTSNGAIRVENVRGTVEARTTNGAIELRSVDGGGSMKTSNGRITAEDIGGKCSAETTNGPIELALQRVPKDGIRAETSNGSITVKLPRDAGVRVEASTSNSSISSDFDLGSDGSDSEERRRNHMSGAIGGGGPIVDLTTRNGHISILKR
jgi:DUF4097 and DUF4098 domain-containing protein YvlB